MKKHFHMVVATIIFTQNAANDVEQGIPSGLTVNAIIQTQDGQINIAALGHAQQSAQIQFHQKIGQDFKVTVRDVIIDNLINLGQFTDEEWAKAPEGTKLQEKVPSSEELLASIQPANS